MMKRKSARYLGMTGTQLAILAGLSVVAVLSVGGGALLILMMSLSPNVAAVPVPLSTQMPATVSPTPASQATAEPTLTLMPTAPVVATIVPPGGWIEFKTQEAGLWLPENFVGGDMLNHRSETIQKVNKLGKYFKNVVDQLNEASATTLLAMVDKNIDQSIVITIVGVSHFVSTEDKSIDQFIQDDLNSDVNGTPVAMFVTVNETKKVTLLGREARRLTYQAHGVGLEAIRIVYYIKDGTDFWGVSYSLDPNEFVDMLPMVEQSIHTFNLTK
jgi:hypothetical protein